ncbi:MAG: bifunctional (p)ppGpp synthetase/guanosine-3',5'-bis(diphosphate) 3'-pyrophosphohydrolase [Oscillospiraceae bacterium]|nr:bifunctional (p)ppGpp synthetase/guanosine-3',5'-bis(diphosphate) 3'-pyrophosphohydrolase [Oscillospiraceae bacterium]
MPSSVKTYQDLLDAIAGSGRSFDMEMIEKAYHVAEKAHDGQKRKSGDPYISHPIATAIILVELGMDSECVAAGLLHDVVEDTKVSLEEITKLFNPSVAHLIDGVTKLGKIPYHTREEEQAENIRKMLIAMADDIRVIIIKLADRLHNMRTIEYMSPQKQRDKALENMEVFAPIAHRLGIRTVKEELEDLSLRCLDPMGYAEIEKNLDLKREERAKFIADIEQRIMERMQPVIPKVYVEGRVKSINGIYRKVFIQGRSMDEIFDVYAIRVIVDTVNDCYNALGIVHDLFCPLPNRFKDYISTPKPNLYQSLHTTVLSKEGIPFEVQIRTWEMHHTAEYGIAAHWKYKLGMSSSKSDNLEESLAWVRQMLENQTSDDATDLVKTIKSDLSQETVFVFTPAGEVISLPAGSTVIDFAYAIHSAVGNRMIGAKVNKRIVPIDYVPKNGEIVEVLTTKEVGNGPSRDWLNIVRTSEAKNKIRQWFKRERREENVQAGRSEVERELRRSGISLSDSELTEILSGTMKKKNCNSLEDLFCAIGYGGIALTSIMPKIKEAYAKKREREGLPSRSERTAILEPHPVRNKGNGILVEGMENCLTKLAKCCSPLPGDDIIGFITRGYGVSIHKRECTNVPADLSKAEEPERWVKAHWVGTVQEEFVATLEIVADTRTGLLMEVTQQFYNMRVPVHSLNSRVAKDGSTVITVSITIGGAEHLAAVIHRLSNISGITSIRRS